MNASIDFGKLFKQAEVVTEQYTRTPNYIIDDLFMAELSDKAFKCYSLILRQTVGFNRTTTSIATSTFKKYCGIKKNETVYVSIKELEQMKLVSVVRKTGTTNEVTLLSNQYHQTVVPPNGTSTVEGDGASTVEGDGTSTVEGDTIKEKKEKKESESEKDPVDEVLNLWTPNLHSLNSWLQRSGEMPMTQNLVNELLLEINSHYEPRLKVGLISDTQMYSNFVKWIKRDSKRVRERIATAEQQAGDVKNHNAAPVIDLSNIKPKGFLGGAQ